MKDFLMVNNWKLIYVSGVEGQFWLVLVEKVYVVYMKSGKYQGFNMGGSVGQVMEIIVGCCFMSFLVDVKIFSELLVLLDNVMKNKKLVVIGSMSKDDIKNDFKFKVFVDEKMVFLWYVYIFDEVNVDKNEIWFLNLWGLCYFKMMIVEEFCMFYCYVYVSYLLEVGMMFVLICLVMFEVDIW